MTYPQSRMFLPYRRPHYIPSLHRTQSAGLADRGDLTMSDLEQKKKYYKEHEERDPLVVYSWDGNEIFIFSSM